MQCLNVTANITRPLANFQPDLWGDSFLNYPPQSEATQKQKEEEAKGLKELVQKKLLAVVKDPKERIEYLDAIHRLGVAYHFENDIEDNLQIFHKKLHSDSCYEDDLQYVSLRFRLLRQNGFYVSCDVFEKFKSENGSFKECLASDVQGILNLYEASLLKVHGENILDEALAFSITHLTSFATQLSSPMAEQIAHALKLPLHKRSIRLESRHQISFYESRSSHDKTLLRFAKLDFNLLQELHKMELRDFTRWSRSLDLTIKLPGFMRDRVVETYFWSLGTYHEPKYSYARMCFNKLFRIVSIIDDVYDSYGTVEELEPFTEAIRRWDKTCINELPEYMNSFYEAILDTVEEIEQDLAKEGRSYAVYYLREQMTATCQAYLQEAKWCREKFVPTYDDYKKNGILSSGYLYIFVASLLGMGDVASKDAFEWIHKNSKAPKASCVLTRLLNDISSHKFEKNRDHVASAVDCYMKQFGKSEEETYKEIQLHMEEAWKDINHEMLRPTVVPMPVLTRVINLSRTLYDFYQISEDSYTLSKYLQPKVKAVLIDPVLI